MNFAKGFQVALACLIMSLQMKAQKPDLRHYPHYEGIDLGLTYTPLRSTFKIWSPPIASTQARILLYEQGSGGTAYLVKEMQRQSRGIWEIALDGNLEGKFYTFQIFHNGKWMEEVPDPYAKSVGINGKRAMVINLRKTDPVKWNADRSPVFKHKTDAIIYELHVRDASIAASSGIRNKGKFTGLTETGTKNAEGLATGLDHMRELGVTHIHLLPVYDYNSVDEEQSNGQYNWGYDPLNYNSPEGSYASDANDGAVRIREFKQLVQAFHKNGLRVVMDVVYNHTALTEGSNFNQLVPGYYYRQNAKGGFSDASACGNETASERYMFRKFMLESMKYWVQEYHVDGFRIDLMGIHDIETINLISKELHRIKPDILLYGEGWTAGESPLPESARALKKNAARLDRVAVFSDDIRDGLKGSVFEHTDKGFATGKPGMEESVKFGIVAAGKHKQVDYASVNYSKAPYTQHPFQVITYAECHDNNVLWDKIDISVKADEATRKKMYKLALGTVLTSQGITFLHAGSEFLRSKKGVENSFKSGDSINAIDWTLKTKNYDVYNFVRSMIKLRKDHPAFRMQKASDIAKGIKFHESKDGLITYTIDGKRVGDRWKEILVCLNGSDREQMIVSFKNPKWKAAVIGSEPVVNPVLSNTHKIPAHSFSILYLD